MENNKKLGDWGESDVVQFSFSTESEELTSRISTAPLKIKWLLRPDSKSQNIDPNSTFPILFKILRGTHKDGGNLWVMTFGKKQLNLSSLTHNSGT